MRLALQVLEAILHAAKITRPELQKRFKKEMSNAQLDRFLRVLKDEQWVKTSVTDAKTFGKKEVSYVSNMGKMYRKTGIFESESREDNTIPTKAEKKGLQGTWIEEYGQSKGEDLEILRKQQERMDES